MDISGDMLVASSAAATVAGYAIRVLIDVATFRAAEKTSRSACLNWKRIAWTAGFIACVCHVMLAFAYHHNWSHAAAFAHTAKQTAAVTGIDWGGGVYFNYLFMAVWGIDVCLAWFRVDWWLNARRYQLAMHTTFAFMMFNATVVFGPSRWRSLGAVFCSGLLLVLAIQRRNYRASTNP